MLFAADREKPSRSVRNGHVDVIRRARDGARTEGHDVGLGARHVQAIDVAAERRCVRQQDMSDEHRLSAPQDACRTASPRRRPARPDSRARPPASRIAASTAGIRRFRYSRKSSDTCSLRDRPVCSRLPASPMRSTSSRSTNECTSSSSARSRRAGSACTACAHGFETARDRARVVGRQHARARERLRPRQASSDVVVEQSAIDGRDRPYSKTSASGRSEKRPDHNVGFVTPSPAV